MDQSKFYKAHTYAPQRNMILIAKMRTDQIITFSLIFFIDRIFSLKQTHKMKCIVSKEDFKNKAKFEAFLPI